MGILQDFANAQAVNEALKNGVAAHEALTEIKNDISANTEAINKNETDISSLKEKVQQLENLPNAEDGEF